jgi:drug/metabolite transporter (DMT)-like permease
VACLGAAVFLGELLRPLQLAGAALTLVAVALVVLSQPRRSREELAESAAETDAP